MKYFSRKIMQNSDFFSQGHYTFLRIKNYSSLIKIVKNATFLAKEMLKLLKNEDKYVP